MTARPAVEALAVRIKADEVLLAHFVEPDSGALHPDHLRPGEPSAHVPVDVVGLAFAGKDATREDEITLERALVGRRTIDHVLQWFRHGCQYPRRLDQSVAPSRSLIQSAIAGRYLYGMLLQT